MEMAPRPSAQDGSVCSELGRAGCRRGREKPGPGPGEALFQFPFFCLHPTITAYQTPIGKDFIPNLRLRNRLLLKIARLWPLLCIWGADENMVAPRPFRVEPGGN